MTFKELRERSEMKMTQYAAYFGIPYGTVQHWEYGERSCPAYLIDLMQYKLEREGLLKSK